jgi:hypothetical protein
MSYRELLQNQIKDLEERIAKFEGDKTILMDQLQKLRKNEFEEEMREESSQQLLKG